MAVLTRLELATSAVTGQRSNQLSYSTKARGSIETILKIAREFLRKYTKELFLLFFLQRGNIRFIYNAPLR